ARPQALCRDGRGLTARRHTTRRRLSAFGRADHAAGADQEGEGRLDMDLSTQYLGFRLPHPFIAGASPLSGNLDSVRQLEDAGAAAVIMSSLFEEELVGEQLATNDFLDAGAESSAEALTYLPMRSDWSLGPEEYLEYLSSVKAAVAVPVIASLNGTTAGGWLDYAGLMAQAGADAIELNVYRVVT